MSNAFSGLKRRKTDFSEMEKKFEAQTSNKIASNDDRFYYPERDDQGNGYAVIRFLPTGTDSSPFVRYYKHQFKGLGGWFIHNCRTSIGEDCPVCKVNSELVSKFGGKWESVPDREKTIVRDRKRQMYYTSNIVVVEDPENPENEGKVFLFRYGMKIMEKIKAAITPKFPKDPQLDPFNPWSGANFTLKICKVKGQTNYDQSSFDTPGPLYDDDKAIEALAENLYDLGEFTNEEFFTSYEAQEKHLERVLGIGDRAASKESNEPIAKSESKPKSEDSEDAPSATNDLADASDLESLFDDDPDDDIPF